MPLERSVLNDRRRNRAGFLAAAAALVLGGFVGGRITAPEGSSPAQPNTPATSDPVPTSRDETETPPSRENAVDSAAAFARIMGSIRADGDGYVEAVENIATPSWRDEARKLAEAGVGVIAGRYGPDGASTFTPVRYRLARFDEREAVVEIWGVGVSSGGPHDIESTWGIGTFTLAWVDDEWRLAGATSSPGPMPDSLGGQESRPASALDDFSEYLHAPTP